jgi:phenylalanyl-tRNA synthetase alpha chain
MVDLIEKVEQLKRQALAELEKAGDLRQLEELHSRYLGRKGEIKAVLRSLGQLSAEDRPRVGHSVNQATDAVRQAFEARQAMLGQASQEDRIRREAVDVTLPGRRAALGAFHPLTRITNEIVDIFAGLGFDVATGPEIESDYYNFEALNIPKDHPARDMQDTFYLSDDIVLRTHTSPVQVRYMEVNKPPIRIVSPGRVYRCETADASHLPMFNQVEGLMVDEGIHFGHLKGVLEVFVHRMFSPETRVRFRPSFFPFTEPSAEVDIQCVACQGSGASCRVCKGTGWLEIMGAGMVDPAVFQFVDYDSEKYTGFAFGMGCERVAMLKYGIDDIRLFYDNDVRILSQFQ